MALPLIARVLALASRSGPTILTKAGKRRLASQGLAGEAAAVERGLQKVVRDQASNIRTGRRYRGVHNLDLDPDHRASLNLDVLARRVAAGEAPNTAARNMLFEGVSMKMRDGSVVRGRAAQRLAEDVTAWNRQVGRTRGMRGYTDPRTGTQYTQADLASLADSDIYEIDTRYITGEDAIRDLMRKTPLEIITSKHEGSLVNMAKSFRTARIPESISNVILDALTDLGPGRLASLLRDHPVLVGELFGSDELRYRSNLRGTYSVLGISMDPDAQHMKDLEEFLGH